MSAPLTPTSARSLRREGAEGIPHAQLLLDDAHLPAEPPAHVIAQHLASLTHQRAVILNRRLGEGWCFVWDRALLRARERQLVIEVERIDRESSRAFTSPHMAPWHSYFLTLDDAEDLAMSMPDHWQFRTLYTEVVEAVRAFRDARGAHGAWWRFLRTTAHRGGQWPARLR